MLILYFILYVAGAWVSQRHAAEYFWVGPVFGVVVVLWASKSLKDIARRENAAFIAASAVIYALVYHISKQSWSSNSVVLESLFGPLPTGVFVGSLLLPMTHSLILATPRLKAFKTSLVLMLSFYAVTLLANAADYLNLGENFNFIAIAIFVWQGIYLFDFFPERLRAVKTAG